MTRWRESTADEGPVRHQRDSGCCFGTCALLLQFCAGIEQGVKPPTPGFGAHAIPTIAYIVGKTKTPKDVRRVLESLLSGLGVAAVTEAGIRRSLISPLADSEDAVTLAAEECQANYIVTRKTRNFARSSVRAILPEIFLET